MPPDRHLVLVGLMGSGKSAVGRRLARRLDRGFLDTDAVVEELAGRTVAEVFDEDGEAAFRSLERNAVRRVLEAPEPAVVATGGGAVLDRASRRTMVDRGLVVWLDPPLDAIASRVADDGVRPLLVGEPTRERLARLRTARAELYAEASHVRITLDGDIDAVADAVLAAIDGLEAA